MGPRAIAPDEAADPRAEERYDAPLGILALAYGVLGPAVVWLARLKISYILIPFACQGRMTWTLHLTSAVAAALTALAGWIAYRAWRHTGLVRDTEGGGTIPRTRFLALFGLLSAGVFLATILAEWILVFMIDPCLTMGRRVGN